MLRYSEQWISLDNVTCQWLNQESTRLWWCVFSMQSVPFLTFELCRITFSTQHVNYFFRILSRECCRSRGVCISSAGELPVSHIHVRYFGSSIRSLLQEHEYTEDPFTSMWLTSKQSNSKQSLLFSQGIHVARCSTNAKAKKDCWGRKSKWWIW